jgi:REP element-mobilizing transposase RayT
MPTRAHSSALRKGRASVAGQAYILTAVAANGSPIFGDFWLACAAARALSDPSAWPAAALLSWVLMPDHLHLLVQIEGSEPLSLTMPRVKALVSASSHRLGGPVRIWQPGFHDHALRTEESVREVSRYIVANPLRARLVQRIGDYAFWNSIWLEHSLEQA